MANVTNIQLNPLDERGVASIVTQALHRSEGYCALLTAFAYQRSAGNPFALRTFLEDCQKKSFILFDWSDSTWRYDLDAILQHFRPDVQVSNDFILEQLQDLPHRSRQILAWAALLGTPFRFSVVKSLMESHSHINNQASTKHGRAPDLVRESSQDIVRGLETLLYSAILVSTEQDQFEFCHPRWRTASKALAQCSHKTRMHYDIARTLMSDESSSEDVFALAVHILRAVKLIKDHIKDRAPYRRILTQAANQLTESNSIQTRLQYLSNAITLLQDAPWSDENPDCSYSETLLLHIQASEAYSRTSYTDAAQRLLQTTLQNSRTVFDKVPSYILLSRILVKRGEVIEAFATLREALSQFNIIVEDSSWDECDVRFKSMQQELEDLTVDALDDREVSEDTTQVAVSELFSEAIMLGFWIDQRLYYNMSLTFLTQTLRHGITAHASQSFGNVGSIAAGRFDRAPLIEPLTS